MDLWHCCSKYKKIIDRCPEKKKLNLSMYSRIQSEFLSCNQFTRKKKYHFIKGIYTHMCHMPRPYAIWLDHMPYKARPYTIWLDHLPYGWAIWHICSCFLTHPRSVINQYRVWMGANLGKQQMPAIFVVWVKQRGETGAHFWSNFLRNYLSKKRCYMKKSLLVKIIAYKGSKLTYLDVWGFTGLQ